MCMYVYIYIYIHIHMMRCLRAPRVLSPPAAWGPRTPPGPRHNNVLNTNVNSNESR